MTMDISAPLPKSDPRPAMRAGAAGLLLLVGVLGGWAATAKIQGAVILSGAAVVSGLPKTVQSLEGGMVQSIAVRNGDMVAAGDLLVAFDATLARANLDAAQSRMADTMALHARLTAESQGLAAPDFDATPAPVVLPFSDDEIAARRAVQARLFEIRAEVRQERRTGLDQTLEQLRSRVAGADGQIAALEEQRASFEEEIATLTDLRAEGLLRRRELTTLERQRAEVQGRIATLRAERQESLTRMEQSALETRQADLTFREEVDTQLRETTAELAQLALQIVTLERSLSQIELRAPTGGRVHEMEVSTIGGVVAPGATVMKIVPQDRGVDFELRLDPASVDEVHMGQAARIAIPALGPGPAERVPATVSSISADISTDERTGARFYRVELSVAPRDLEALGQGALIPGMSVEAYLETSERSVLTYLVEPITNHLRHALREG